MTWREYKDVNIVTVSNICAKYITMSLSRSIVLDGDVEQLCSDIESLSKLIVLLLAWDKLRLEAADNAVQFLGGVQLKESLGGMCLCAAGALSSAHETLSVSARQAVACTVKENILLVERALFEYLSRDSPPCAALIDSHSRVVVLLEALQEEQEREQEPESSRTELSGTPRVDSQWKGLRMALLNGVDDMYDNCKNKT